MSAEFAKGQRVLVRPAMFPMAVIRTVQAGPAAGVDYNFELLVRGDVDRPAP